MSGPSPGTRHWGLRLSATAATGRKKHDEIFVNLNSILVKLELIIFLRRFGHFARDCPTSAGLNRAALVCTEVAWSSCPFFSFNPEIRLSSYWLCSAKRRRANQRKSCSLKQGPTNHHSGVLSLQQVGNNCAHFGNRFLFLLFCRVGHFARNCAR